MAQVDRLNDPGEHFPYKLDDALSAARTDPEHMSEGIARASAAMVAAQATYLENPTDENRETYLSAQETLVGARQDHRAGRVTIGITADGGPA